jgi:flagellar motor switch protein FliN
VVKSELKTDIAGPVAHDDDDVGTQEKARPARKVVSLLDPEIFGDVKVDISVALGRGTMMVREIADLEAGSIVALDTPLNALVDLKFNDRVIARGEIVSVGDKFGVRITEIAARNP